MTVKNIGITFAILIFDGTMPDINEQFILRLNGIAMIMEICFIILDVCIIMFYAVAWACYI